VTEIGVEKLSGKYGRLTRNREGDRKSISRSALVCAIIR
jgi:hypothetical protein